MCNLNKKRNGEKYLFVSWVFLSRQNPVVLGASLPRSPLYRHLSLHPERVTQERRINDKCEREGERWASPHLFSWFSFLNFWTYLNQDISELWWLEEGNSRIFFLCCSTFEHVFALSSIEKFVFILFASFSVWHSLRLYSFVLFNAYILLSLWMNEWTMRRFLSAAERIQVKRILV